MQHIKLKWGLPLLLIAHARGTTSNAAEGEEIIKPVMLGEWVEEWEDWVMSSANL